MSDAARPYTPTALPPVGARILAFVAILVGGLCGGLIGWSVTDLQCGTTSHPVVIGGAAPVTTTTTILEHHDRSGCTTWDGLGGLGGAVIGAGGTGIVAVLVLRAMSEWRKDLDVEEPPDA